MHVSVRTYRVGGSVDGLMHRVDRDFAEALSQEPGFLGYQALDMGGGRICTISMFHSRAQAEASESLASEWVTEELQDFEIERMGTMNGEVMVSRVQAEVLLPAHH